MTDKELIKQEIERRISLHKDDKCISTYSCGYLDANETLLEFIDSLPEEPKCIYNRTLDERKKFCKYCSAACDVRIEEEPASEDLEEEITNFFPDWLLDSTQYKKLPKIARHFAEWQKQKNQEPGCEVNCTPENEELGKVAIDAWNNHVGLELMHVEEVISFANEIAEWQKHRDFKELLKSDMTQFKKCYEKGKADAMKEMKEALQTEYEKGRFDMREEIMKDAVEGTVKYEISSAEIAPTDIKYKVVSDRVYIPNVKLGDKVKIIIIKPEQQ